MKQFFLTLQGSIEMKDDEKWREVTKKLIKHIENFAGVDNWCVQGSERTR